MKFYDYYRSSAAYRLRIALNLKGLAPERAFVHLRKGEQSAPDYLKLNPQGLVPALLTDDGAVLTQSMAIIEYLDETQPEPPLLPADALGRARVRAISQAISCDIHPLNNLRVLRQLGSLGLDEPTRNGPGWYRHWVEIGFTAIEAMLAGHPATGRFCHGDTPTMADCCLVPQIFNATRFGTEIADYPTIKRIFDALAALPAVADAHPSRQPDTED
ncbi:MAG: maleylacetoacetate isomerase [Alphaproteobacteria bacterium]